MRESCNLTATPLCHENLNKQNLLTEERKPKLFSYALILNKKNPNPSHTQVINAQENKFWY